MKEYSYNSVFLREDVMSTTEFVVSSKIGDITHVKINQPRILDEATIKKLGKELFGLIDREYKIKLLLDFSEVSYLSSAVLGKLVAVHKKVKGTNGTLKFSNLTTPLLEIFKITKLDTVFDIYPSKETALNSFKTQTLN